MKKISSSLIQRSGQIVLVAVLTTVMAVGSLVSPLKQVVLADRFDQQIAELRKQNAQVNAEVDDLESQASSFESLIDKLNAQIASLQASINKNVAEQNRLKKEIKKAEIELEKQRDLLGQNIRAMYLEGEISTLEMLASSKDLSEFLNKQEYRTAVQDKIKTTLDRINALKAKLKSQKSKVEALLLSQKLQQDKLKARQAEQNRLLNLNASQRSALNKKIKGNNARIAELQQQQIIENAKIFGGTLPVGQPGGGGYIYGNARCLHPGWADPPCGQYDWGYPGTSSPRDLYDQWGYGYRNCTSWVAFKLAQAGKSGFTHLGNANQWPGGVPGSWKSYGGGARAGDAAVNPNGYYGHIMYVEAVDGGTVYVSDYNAGGDGYYRSARPVSAGGLVFIHFPG